MTLTPVKSSNISALGWEAETLEVQFVGGARYRYARIPESVHRALLAAPSIGKAFTELIRRHPTVYRYQMISAPVGDRTARETYSTVRTAHKDFPHVCPGDDCAVLAWERRSDWPARRRAVRQGEDRRR